MKTKAALFALFAAAALCSGCGGSSGSPESGPPAPAPSPTPGLFKDNAVTVGGTRRTYDYYIPSGLGSQPAPLVFLLHGHRGDADAMTGADGTPSPFKVWIELAETEKLILVFPEGLVGPDGETGWNDCRGDAQTNPAADDVAFVAALIGGGGHNAPSQVERYSGAAELLIGRQNHDIEMAREVWDFFRGKRL